MQFVDGFVGEADVIADVPKLFEPSSTPATQFVTSLPYCAFNEGTDRVVVINMLKDEPSRVFELDIIDSKSKRKAIKFNNTFIRIVDLDARELKILVSCVEIEKDGTHKAPKLRFVECNLENNEVSINGDILIYNDVKERMEEKAAQVEDMGGEETPDCSADYCMN
jgi:hypothetical protein